MHLTLPEAATQLGKSVRQVRYMIKLGKLPAQKVGGVWFIQSADLSPTPAQDDAADRKEQKLRAAVEDALDAPDRPRRGRRYSVRDLRAVQVALPILKACDKNLGPEHPSTRSLYTMLEHLTRGCHRFAHPDKFDAYRTARDEASRAACALTVHGSDIALELLDHLEQNLMPAIAGLLRRHEPRSRA